MAMITKYGDITTEDYMKYRKSIINRIYAILPMKEEGVGTVDEYISSLNRELISQIDIFENCEKMLAVVCILEYIKTETEHDKYRKEVLHCCNIVSEVGEKNV